MANTYKLIGSLNANAGDTTVFNFTSIPQTYTDLILIASLRSTRGAGNIGDGYARFNGDTGGITFLRTFGDGSGGRSNDTGVGLINAPVNVANSFAGVCIYIPNYTSSNIKSYSMDAVTVNTSGANAYAQMLTIQWSGTSAITSIQVRDWSDGGANNLVQYSSADLYGILKT
jgi:hypothetical protein